MLNHFISSFTVSVRQKTHSLTPVEAAWVLISDFGPGLLSTWLPNLQSTLQHHPIPEVFNASFECFPSESDEHYDW